MMAGHEPWAENVTPWAPLDTMSRTALARLLGKAAVELEFAAEDKERALWERDENVRAQKRAALRYWRAVHREALATAHQRLYDAETAGLVPAAR